MYKRQVEYGITRLAAVFSGRVPTRIGPVRSARITDIDLLAFSDALRTEIDADVLTFGQTLDSQVTMPQVISALAPASDGQAARALDHIADRALPRSLFPSRAIDLGPRSSSIRVDAANPLAATAGFATFAGCRIDKAGTYTLTARKITVDTDAPLIGQATGSYTLRSSDVVEDTLYANLIAQGQQVSVAVTRP